MLVLVRFSNVNGPKGDLDKGCMFIAKLRASGSKIAIQSTGMDYLEVFESSFLRLFRSLQRETTKQKQKSSRIIRKVQAKIIRKLRSRRISQVHLFYTEKAILDLESHIHQAEAAAFQPR